MAPIDWDQLMKLDVQELQDNAALADDMYCVLSDVCIIVILLKNSDVIIFVIKTCHRQVWYWASPIY